MGKAKKGRKGIKEEDGDSDLEIETQTPIEKKGTKKGKEKGVVKNKDVNNDDSDSEIVKSKVSKKNSVEDVDEKPLNKKANKGKKTRKDVSDGEESENDSAKTNKNKKNIKEVSADADSSSEIEKSSNKKGTKGKNKKNVSDDDSDNDRVAKVTTGFGLLQVDSGPEDNSDNEQSDDEKPVVTKSKDNKKTVQNSESANENRTKDAGGKKGKKGRKKRNDSDEDIEKVLAELELEYSGAKPKQNEVIPEEEISDEKKPKSNKNKEQHVSKEDVESFPEELEKDETGEQDGGTVKTAAQKKKEKKEREKQKKLAAKKPDAPKIVEKLEQSESTASNETAAAEESKQDPADGETEDGDKDSKKKKKKGAKEEKEAKDAKGAKGPGKRTIAAMQEALKKIREEEEKQQREEEERIIREEEAEKQRQEQLRLEQERKEKKKQKEKERKDRLKAEGKLLTSKQKADRARAQAMIDALKAQGVELPDVGVKKPRLGTRVKPNKVKQQSSTEKEATTPEIKEEEKKIELQIIEQPQPEKSEEKSPEDDVKDAWDADSSEEEEISEETEQSQSQVQQPETKGDKKDEPTEEESSSEEEDDDDSEEDDDSDDSDGEEDDHRTDAERRRDRAKARILKRREDADKNKTLENLRAAVVCVLGHVDTGKTKILDKLRRTNVQDGEAGGITQQIGATNVPMDNIKEQIKFVKGYSDMELKIPGLLIIDTPGHESFSNLRSRGSSLCDIAILVVDIMHGLEPQTIESLNLLKNRRTPFIVALNKIDRLYDWQTMNRKDVRDIIKGQAANTQLEFEQRTKEVKVQFAEQGMNAALFYENPDPRSYVSLIPTSAVTGEGMGNLLALIVESCQSMLAKRLMYSEELQATVLEVKAIPGLGTTIDCILINGALREGDTMIVAGTDGPIVTQIRSLLMPQPMRELRVKNAYVEYKEIKAAQGVKIAAKELEKAIAGLNLQVAQKPDEVEICRDEVARELKSALSSIKLQERGVYVQASTLGSLEALLEFLRASKIPYSGIRIGPVVKKDVMKASIMLEHDSQYATILAFDVKIERDAQELADTLGVKIFQADIIYHLFDKFMAYREELKQRKREQFKNIAVFPCKLRVLPQFIFNSRDPIVMGVMVEAGIIKEGTPICVPSKEFVELGVVTSIENNHKVVDSARKGQEVCIKIESVSGDAPKMFGRHFDEKDFLVSKITRQSIDACKDYFRDDLIKTDWQLMVELKKQFQIL
ncbi:eukaryotic translation initiation factor 5B [Carabus blaptoides fortunei]